MKKLVSILLAVVVLSASITAFGAENKFGIDVSYHNGTVDYVKEAENSTSFVMIRLGYYNHLDTMFWENVKAAAESGMNFGVYLYSYAYDLSEAKIEADFVLDTLSQMPEEYDEFFTLPVAYDMEESKLTQFSKSQLTQQTVYFCDKMNYAGYTPMVYANLNWFNNYLDLSQLVDKGYKLWYANWTDNPDFSRQKQIGSTGVYADIWQYQAGEKDENGFDRNIAYDLDSLMHKYVLTDETKPTCVKSGKRIFNCSICSDVKEVSTNPLGHSYKTTTTKATTKANGKIVKSCTACGYVYSTKTINAAKTVSLSTTKYVYDGNVKKPTVTVKDANGNKISSSNYTVTYASGRKYVGKYAVKITFKGYYSGSVTKYFTIVPKATKITKLTAARGGFKVNWSKVTAQTTGYQIQIATNSKFTTGVKTYTVSKNGTVSKSVTSLTRGRKYYVRVRTYKTVGSTKYYSAWSKSKDIKTN